MHTRPVERRPDIRARRIRRWHTQQPGEARLLSRHSATRRSTQKRSARRSVVLPSSGTPLGGCSQLAGGKCGGFRGPGSDQTTNTAAWCRLESWEGGRSPRAYWSIGKRYFQPAVSQQQDPGKSCAHRGANYQLMRNFLFAASLAEAEGKSYFGVVTIAPRHFAAKLVDQVEDFQRTNTCCAYHCSVGCSMTRGPLR